MTKYSVSCSGSYLIEDVNAKTLRGAKMIASRMFMQSVGGRITVHENVKHPSGDIEHCVVAVKYGFDKNWTSC